MTDEKPQPQNIHTHHPTLAPQRFVSLKTWELLGTLAVNLFALMLLAIYLFPLSYIVITSFKDAPQLMDRTAPLWPAKQVFYEYKGKSYLTFEVPIDGTIRQLAMIKRGRTSSEFIDPANPDAGLFTWEGNWRSLHKVYRFHLALENFDFLLSNNRAPSMVRNTMIMVIIGEIGVIISSIVVAYGFARFTLPGGDLLFYLLIATILIPEKVTLIPTYFIFVQKLGWNGSWIPLLLPLFFGNAVYIFLLRQNFRSIPRELDEAATLDGAGPLRILFSIILPQCMPVVITISMLHFFYAWNETRQAALYLSTRPDLKPISLGVQNFQSLTGSENVLQAGALVIMIVPVLVLFLLQRYFARDLVITGLEK